MLLKIIANGDLVYAGGTNSVAAAASKPNREQED